MAMLNNQRVPLVSGCTRYLISQQLKKIRTWSILQLWCSIKRQQTSPSQHAQGKGSIRKMVWQKKHYHDKHLSLNAYRRARCCIHNPPDKSHHNKHNKQNGPACGGHLQKHYPTRNNPGSFGASCFVLTRCSSGKPYGNGRVWFCLTLRCV